MKRHNALANLQAPRLTICIAAYYCLLVLVGAFSNVNHPIDGVLAMLFLTHMFIVVALPAHGIISVLIIVGVPVAIAVCAVRLTGWWRVIAVMGLLLGSNLYGIYSAAGLYG